jgi:hypothetical protein
MLSMMFRDHGWVFRKHMTLLFGFAVLMLGAASAVLFAGLADEEDYPRAGDLTTAQFLGLSPDLGERDYMPNQAPSHTTLLTPKSDTAEPDGVFSSVSRGNNQFNKIQQARKANAPKSCHPFDKGCLQRLACQGVTPSSSASRPPCMPGDIICTIRMACG